MNSATQSIQPYNRLINIPFSINRIRSNLKLVIRKLVSKFGSKKEYTYDPFDPYSINEYVAKALQNKEIRRMKEELVFSSSYYRTI